MRRTCIVLLCFFTVWKAVRCRQYDVHAEAIKLYGEDLSMVLKRFRRTPEYLSILNKKINAMLSETDDKARLIKFFYQDYLEKNVKEFLAKESNDVKDKAVKTAIHKIIESMGPEDDVEEKSTRMPSEDKEVATTTPHAEQHEVTTQPTVRMRAGATYGYRVGNRTKY